MAVEDPGQSLDLFLHIADDVAGDGTGRSGKGHGYLYFAFVTDLYFIDQAKVEDVDRDLWIEDGAERTLDVISKRSYILTHDSTDFTWYARAYNLICLIIDSRPLDRVGERWLLRPMASTK